MLAAVAGFALLARVTEGVGLYCAMAAFIVRAGKTRYSSTQSNHLYVVVSILVALGFATATGLINTERWGNPFAFSPLQYNIDFSKDAHIMKVWAEHGAFQLVRVPFGMLYYVTGLPIKRPFTNFIDNNYLIVEGPRIPLLFVCPLALLLAGWGIGSLFRAKRLRITVPAVLIGAQSVTALLILGFPNLALRYTFDLSGLLGAAIAVGFYQLLSEPRGRLLYRAMVLLVILGVAGSWLTLLRYKWSTSVCHRRSVITLSKRVQPWVCPGAGAIADQRASLALVTPSCPPFW